MLRQRVRGFTMIEILIAITTLAVAPLGIAGMFSTAYTDVSAGGKTTMAVTEHSMAYNTVWGDGAFAAAEAGISVGINQLSPNTTAATQAIPMASIGGSYSSRSGGKTDAGAQPLKFVQSRAGPGYSIAIGTGYNPAGYAFHSYQTNATGTGPRNAVRAIEIQAEYGPVAQ